MDVLRVEVGLVSESLLALAVPEVSHLQMHLVAVLDQ